MYIFWSEILINLAFKNEMEFILYRFYKKLHTLFTFKTPLYLPVWNYVGYELVSLSVHVGEKILDCAHRRSNKAGCVLR